MITSKELREKYLKFFKSKGHAIIPSASLIPENDPTILFTTAGMHPLVPYLLGEKHPEGQKLANVQKCIRTDDIDEVGNQWHLSFFEMLGNWSLGDSASPDSIGQGGYWKEDALKWSFEFLTSSKWLNIPKEKIAVSVFAGDNDAPFDKEAYNIWRDIEIPENRIYKYSKSENWWGPAGQTGPCGPDSEMFYISDKKPCSSECEPRCNCGKYVEIWNDVFMEYNKTKIGKYEPLAQKNVDTGMGLERIVAVLNGYEDNYQESIKPIIEKIEELSGKKYNKAKETTRSMRIIADHIRAAVFIMGDDLGIAPSNTDQGYVVRKFIRRTIRHSKLLDIKNNFTIKVAEIAIKIFKDAYPEIERNKKFIFDELKKEEEKFKKTLEKGLKEFKIIQKNISAKADIISGKEAFNLYQTYGFPLEMTKELAKENNLKVNDEEFNEELKKHQELSRAGAKEKFKGGLADHSEQTTKLHTAAHLLLAALRQELGDHVAQKGSNITEKRLRLDFSHSEKLTDEQKNKVENLVNNWISQDLKVKCEEMPTKEALNQGAIGVFRYGDKVKVYTIGPSTSSGRPCSVEICGGPHVKNTGALGKFKIIKQEASSAGVRRIKATLEE